MSEPSLNLTDKPNIALGYRMQWEPAQDCHVLLYPEGMVQLNETAAIILQQCDGEKSIQRIIEDLQQEFAEPDLQEDVVALLQEALQRGWVCVR